MSEPTEIAGWVFASAIRATVLLLIGLVVIRLLWQPAQRQRAGEWVLVGCLIAAVMGLVSAAPRLALMELSTDHWAADLQLPIHPTNNNLPDTSGTIPDLTVEMITVGDTEPATSDSSVTSPPLDDIGHSPGARSARFAASATLGRSAAVNVAHSTDERVERGDRADLKAPLWTRLVAATYFLGAAGMLIWLTAGRVMLHRLVTQAVAPPQDVLEIWQRLSPGGKPVARLLVSRWIHTPFTFGLFRPVVLLPPDFCRVADDSVREPLSARDSFARWTHLEVVLRHELAHVLRRDARTSLLVLATQVVFFYHPLVWQLRRQLRLYQEYVADAWAATACDSPPQYAQILYTMTSRQRVGFMPMHGLGAFDRPSDLLRRIEMLTGRRSTIQFQCPTRRSMALAIGVTTCAVLISVATIVAQPVARDETGVATQPVAEPAFGRSMYILQQPNTQHLLLGLPQRLTKAVETEPRSGATWNGLDDGGSIRLRIIADSPIRESVTIGLFTDPRWWAAPPVQLRQVSGEGEHELSRIPAGRYAIGAMVGALPQPEVLGFHGTWPDMIEVQPGESTEVRLEMSTQLSPLSWAAQIHRNPRTFVSDWGRMDPTRMISVRVVDADGTPLPYTRVVLVRRTEEKTFDFHTIGADQHGFAYYDGIEGTFSVIVNRHEFQTDPLGGINQSKKMDQLYNAADRPRITVTMEPFSGGTGRVTGRVQNHLGQPLREFHVNVNRYVGERHDWSDSRGFGLTVPVIDDDGQFDISGLGAGTYQLSASAFDYPTHVYQKEDEKTTFTIPDEPGAVVQADVILEAREARYGRLVYEDGTPVSRGSWRLASTRGATYSIEPDGRFRALVAPSERRPSSVDRSWPGEPLIELQGRGDETSVHVSFDELSSDPENPRSVILPKPAMPSPPVAAEVLPEYIAAVTSLANRGVGVRTNELGEPVTANFLDTAVSDGDLFPLRQLPTLQEVNLNRSRVTDAGMVYLEESNQLVTLDLTALPITDAGLRSLSGLARLENLKLGNTRITDRGLEQLAGLTRLRSLTLTGTRVTDHGLSHIARLSSLRSLDLSETEVSDAGLAHLAQLTELESLSLWNGRITDEGLAQITGLSKLRHLDLRGAQLTSVGLALLPQFAELESLNLFGVPVTDDDVEHIIALRILTSLYLGETELTDAGLRKLTPLTRLKTLYLSPHITDDGLESLFQFEDLEVLGLNSSKITDAGLAHIGRLAGLTNLFLRGTAITDEGVDHLMKLKELYFIDVSETNITQNGTARLRSLPRIQSVFPYR